MRGKSILVYLYTYTYILISLEESYRGIVGLTNSMSIDICKRGCIELKCLIRITEGIFQELYDIADWMQITCLGFFMQHGCNIVFKNGLCTIVKDHRVMLEGKHKEVNLLECMQPKAEWQHA